MSYSSEKVDELITFKKVNGNLQVFLIMAETLNTVVAMQFKIAVILWNSNNNNYNTVDITFS